MSAQRGGKRAWQCSFRREETVMIQRIGEPPICRIAHTKCMQYCGQAILPAGYSRQDSPPLGRRVSCQWIDTMSICSLPRIFSTQHTKARSHCVWCITASKEHLSIPLISWFTLSWRLTRFRSMILRSSLITITERIFGISTLEGYIRWIQNRKGVRQCCRFCPILFSFAIEPLLQRLAEGNQAKIYVQQIGSQR